MLRLAVLGNPIAHSRSPEIHQLFATQYGLAISYEKILVPLEGFSHHAHEFLEQGGTGFNVTLPFKRVAFEWAQRCSPSAAQAEAVNTISIMEDGTLKGDNTDGPGLVQDLTANLEWNLAGRSILVLGAGGAVNGIVRDLLACEPALVHIHNRTIAKAKAIVDSVADPRLTSVKPEQLQTGYDVVINGTSAGLHGNLLDVPAAIVGKHSKCYDMSYGSGLTSFLGWCADAGSTSLADGVGMLVEQAAGAFLIWTGLPVETPGVIRTLRESL